MSHHAPQLSSSSPTSSVCCCSPSLHLCISSFIDRSLQRLSSERLSYSFPLYLSYSFPINSFFSINYNTSSFALRSVQLMLSHSSHVNICKASGLSYYPLFLWFLCVSTILHIRVFSFVSSGRFLFINCTCIQYLCLLCLFSFYVYFPFILFGCLSILV